MLDRRGFIAATLSGCIVFPHSGRGAVAARLIVPAPGGSRTGQVARLLATAMAAELGEPVEIANFDEAADAYTHLAAAPADGRTLGVVAADVAALHWRQYTNVKPTAFAPIALVATDPAGVHVRASDNAQNARDLVQRLRAGERRGVSGAGRGAIWHIAALRWQQAAGLGVLPWQPAANPREAVAQLVSGTADVVVCSIPEARVSEHKSAFKTIGVMAGRRHPRYPAVPTLAESGVRLEAGIWRGVAGPAGLPAAARTQASNALKRAFQSPAFAREAQRRGFALTWADQSAFGSFIAREDEAMGRAIKAGGLA